MTINYMGNDRYKLYLDDKSIIELSSADIKEIADLDIPDSKIEALEEKIEELQENAEEIKRENEELKTGIFHEKEGKSKIMQLFDDKKVDDDLFFYEMEELIKA